MADKKYEQYTEETAPTGDDLVLIKEKTAGATRRVQLTNIIPAGTVTTAKIADANVTPVKWTNPYKFHAYRSAAMNVAASGTDTKIAFDAEEFDTNSNFASGTYTIPVNGYYVFSARVPVSMTTGDFCYIKLYKNGAGLKNGSYSVAPGNNVTALLLNTPPILFSAGNTVDVYVGQTAGATKAVIVGQTECYFGGYLVSQT